MDTKMVFILSLAIMSIVSAKPFSPFRENSGELNAVRFPAYQPVYSGIEGLERYPKSQASEETKRNFASGSAQHRLAKLRASMNQQGANLRNIQQQFRGLFG